MCARGQDRQGLIHEPLDPHEHVLRRGGRGEVGTEPRRLGRAEGEGTENRGAGQVDGEQLPPRGVEHASDVGAQSRGGLWRRPRRGQSGEGLEGVVGGGTPGLALLVQRVDVPAEAAAVRDEVPTQRGDPLGVRRGRFKGHRAKEPTRDGGPPVGVGRHVEQQVAEAELTEPGAQRGGRAAVAGDVEHAAPTGGGVRDDGGQRSGLVAAGGGVDKQVAAAR